MSYIKGWSRRDWGTWALPLYVTYLSYDALNGDFERRTEHVVSVRILCFGFFVEWSR